MLIFKKSALLFLLLAFSVTASAQESTAISEEQALSLLARIAIVTGEYEKSKEFYGDILGFTAVFSGDISRPVVREQMQLPQDATIHFTIYKKPEGIVGGYDMSGAMVGLLHVSGVELPAMQRQDNAPLSVGEPMLAIMTNNLDIVAGKMREAGIEFILPPMSAHDGTEMEMVVRDPAGVRVHVLEIVDK